LMSCNKQRHNNDDDNNNTLSTLRMIDTTLPSIIVSSYKI